MSEHHKPAKPGKPADARAYRARLAVLPATNERLSSLSRATGIRAYRLADDLLNAAISDYERQLNHVSKPNN